MLDEKTIAREIGKVIRAERARAELSREELAMLGGIGKTVIFDIEHGKSTVKLSTLLRIFEVLNIKIQLNNLPVSISSMDQGEGI